MTSETSRKKAEEIIKPAGTGLARQLHDAIAAALDEAQERGREAARENIQTAREAYERGLEVGAQRERWLCHQIALSEPNMCGGSEDFCPRCDSHIADAIAARGPMLGPKEEK